MKKGHAFLICITVFFVALLGMPSTARMQVAQDEPWILFYANEIDRWGMSDLNLDHNDIISDFRAQDWNIQGSVECGSGGDAITAWSLFTGTYSSNPAICVISGQSYFIDFVTGTSPGQQSSGWVYGNEGRKWSSEDVALVKYTIHNGRPVIVIWTGERFDTGDLRPLMYAWKWVAKNPSADRQWYVFNDAGSILDRSIETIHFVTVDNSAPTVEITSPVSIERPTSEAETVSGMITITGTASDSLSGIQKVEVSIDGGSHQLCTGTTSWSTSLNTVNLTDGSHALIAKATDGAGNIAETSITIWVWNDKAIPIIDWDAPVINPDVPMYASGVTRIKAKVTDYYGIQKVTISIDGGAEILMNYDAENDVYYYDWDTTTIAEGKHSIHIKAEDLNGNISMSIISMNKPSEISELGGGNLRTWVLAISGLGAVVSALMYVKEQYYD